MGEKVVLGIDLGTTGNRVMAFSADGEVRAKAYYEFTQIFPRPGWVEHNPREILDTALRALREVLAAVGAENVVSLGITNQRETAILWDRATGEPVYNAIVWQDRRTEPLCRKLSEYQRFVKNRSGLFLDPYFSATKIRWLLDEIPGLRARMERGEVVFGTPDTWVLWHLTGRRTHATDPGNASRTLLFNLQELRFDRDLLGLFEIPAAALPEVRDSDADFGATDPALTGRAIPITAVLGDQQAALFAHGGWQTGVVKATYGTGIFVLTNTLATPVASDSLLTTIAWKTGDEVNYALEGSVFMGGASVQWLRDNLKIIASAAETEALAAALPDNEDVYFVPAFQGLGAPYWDPTARGLLIGLTRKTTPAVIVRAVLESLAYQTRDVIAEMQHSAPFPMQVLRADGGASANAFLMQFQADLLQMPVERSAIIETTALGAAGLSGVCSGFWTRERFFQNKKNGRTFVPAVASEQAESLYSKWQEAIQRSLHWSR